MKLVIIAILAGIVAFFASLSVAGASPYDDHAEEEAEPVAQHGCETWYQSPSYPFGGIRFCLDPDNRPEPKPKPETPAPKPDCRNFTTYSDSFAESFDWLVALPVCES